MNEEEQTTPNPENQNTEPANETPVASAPPASSEDQLFQSAGNNMDVSDEHPQTPAPVVPPKKSKKKPIFIIILVVLLLVGGAVIWYFLNEGNSSTGEQPAEQATEAPAELTFEPNTVAYAFRSKDADPYVLYTRPAVGEEDRVEVQKLTRDSAITHSDTYGSNVAFVDDDDIYASTDHGASYKKVFEGESGSQITSMMLSEDGNKIGFGYLKEAGKSNTVKSIDLGGENETDVFTTSNPGVYLLGWNDTTALYREGCYNCDGGDFNTMQRNLGDDKTTRLLEEVANTRIVDVAAANDVSSLTYAVGTSPAAGASLLPPYEIYTLDVAKNESNQVATVGKAGEKNTNGTNKTYSIMVGYSTGNNTPYYTSDNGLYLVRNDEGLLFFEAEQNILGVDYVGDTTVITRFGKSTADYTMSNYEVESKKSTTILLGDNNTDIFGVTTD